MFVIMCQYWHKTVYNYIKRLKRTQNSCNLDESVLNHNNTCLKSTD